MNSISFGFCTIQTSTSQNAFIWFSSLCCSRLCAELYGSLHWPSWTLLLSPCCPPLKLLTHKSSPLTDTTHIVPAVWPLSCDAMNRVYTQPTILKVTWDNSDSPNKRHTCYIFFPHAWFCWNLLISFSLRNTICFYFQNMALMLSVSSSTKWMLP